MTVVLSIVLALHVLAATFWAGSTFTLARTDGKTAGQLFGPQMGAATVTVLAGGYVWAKMFGGSPGHMVVGIGALAAVVAAGVQGMFVGRERERISTDEEARARALLGHRIASVLLALAIVCMVIQ